MGPDAVEREMHGGDICSPDRAARAPAAGSPPRALDDPAQRGIRVVSAAMRHLERRGTFEQERARRIQRASHGVPLVAREDVQSA
jgi:hypothetical protein